MSTAHQRLREAGLLAVVDRVAAEYDTTSGALLTVTGIVSPAQAALFRALAAEGQGAAAIARLLGWGRPAVARALDIPEPKRSETRLVESDLRALIAEAIAPLQAEIAALRKIIAEREVSANEDMFRGVLRVVARQHGISLQQLLSPQRGGLVLAARKAAVVALTRRGLSQPAIGRLLRRDPSSVWALQHQAGVGPRRARKAAA
jgi:predicted transcriptional regulator